jgi:hypothetical protein
MIAPLLPGAESLPSMFEGKVDYVLIDRMNYHYADWVYRKRGLQEARERAYFVRKGNELMNLFEKKRIPCQMLF